MKTFNLVEYRDNRKIRTVQWNIIYQLAKGLKMRLECAPLVPGTYFKIEPNSI